MPINIVEEVRAGGIFVWGSDIKSQISGRPKRKDFRCVAPGGSSQSLGIDLDGGVHLWGTGDWFSAQSTKKSGATSGGIVGGFVPAAIAAGGFVDGALGHSHLIVRRRDGAVVAWGTKQNGTPLGFPLGTKALAVAAGSDHDVWINLDGTLGRNPTSFSMPPAGKFTKVAARSDYALAIHEDGRLFGWGNANYFSKWSGWVHEGADRYYVPGAFTAVAAGVVGQNPVPHVVAVKADGTAVGWGADAEKEASGAPPGVRFTQVAAGRQYSIGLADDGTIYQWGKYPGEGDPNNAPIGRYISISAGSAHATAVGDDHIRIVSGPDAEVRTSKQPMLEGDSVQVRRPEGD